MGTITSANSVFTLSIPDVFPSPVQLEGYAVDDAFDTENVDTAEAQIGVDGRLSAGFTPYLVKQTIHLQADSDSLDVFENWRGAMSAATEVLFASCTILLPSTGRVYVGTKGVLTKAKPLPDAKKVLGPQAYEVTWETLTAANA